MASAAFTEGKLRWAQLAHGRHSEPCCMKDVVVQHQQRAGNCLRQRRALMLHRAEPAGSGLPPALAFALRCLGMQLDKGEQADGKQSSSEKGGRQSL